MKNTARRLVLRKIIKYKHRPSEAKILKIFFKKTEKDTFNKENNEVVVIMTVTTNRLV